jgi:hypothetical protein
LNSPGHDPEVEFAELAVTHPETDADCEKERDLRIFLEGDDEVLHGGRFR